jgi:adenosylcobyric acid synthase
VLGICGGCQMLGETIADPHGVESEEPIVDGLGLLPLITRFGREKRTSQVRARAARGSFLCEADGRDVFGYEIHMGRLERRAPASGAFVVSQRNGRPDDDLDGGVSQDGVVIGTMLHGLFENAPLRATLMANLRRRKGIVGGDAKDGTAGPLAAGGAAPGDEYDRLADSFRSSVRIDLLRAFAGVEAGPPGGR